MKKEYGAEEPTTPLDFTIGKDTFYATPVAPGGVLADLADVEDADNNLDKMKVVMGFFDKVLHPDSATLFATRLRDPGNPISLPVAMEVFTDLIEEYTDGVRPTVPQPVSRAGSGETGPSSTGRARSAGTTPKKAASRKS